MPRRGKFSYHVTTHETAKKIIDAGFIDPHMSQGKRPVSWYVSSSMITWAMAHVCQRHSCELNDIVVLTVATPEREMQSSSKKGIYWCDKPLYVLEMISAAMWLQREERMVYIRGTKNHNVRDRPRW